MVRRSNAVHAGAIERMCNSHRSKLCPGYLISLPSTLLQREALPGPVMSALALNSFGHVNALNASIEGGGFRHNEPRCEHSDASYD
jgi:hypothetical protein